MKSSETKPIAVVYSTAYFPFVGGAEVALLEVVKRLPGYDWHVVTARMKWGLPKVEVLNGVTVHRVGPGWGAIDKFLLPLLSVRVALRLTKGQTQALVWSMMASQASVGAAFLKFLRPRFHLVLTLQEGDEESHLKRYVGGSEFLYKIFIRPWYRLVFRSADSITAISQYLKTRALNSGAEVPVDVIPNGVDLDRYKDSPSRTPDGVVRLITASRLVEKNGVGDLIEALPLLPSNVELTILGGGHLESRLRARVEELGLGLRVHFLGAFTQDQEFEYLKESDIFVRPALSEGLGIAYLHAMAVGLPVIGTHVGGIPDFLKDGVTGFFCEPKNPSSIARVVQEVLSDPHRAERVAAEGKALVRSHYGWDGIARRMGNVFARAGAPRVLLAPGVFPPDPGGPARHAFEYRERFHLEGYVVRTIPFSLVRHLPAIVRHFAYVLRLLRSSRYADLIFAHDALSVGFPAFVASRLVGRPLLLRIGGDVVWERQAERGATRLSMKEFYAVGGHKKTFAFTLVRTVLCGAQKVIVPSPLLRDLYVGEYGVHPSHVEVISNPIEKEGNVSEPQNPALGFFASRLVAYKNLETVLSALRLLPPDSSLRIEIAGDGPERRSLEERARELGVMDRIVFRGLLSEDEVRELSSRAGFALAPALTEFNPNYLLAALGKGRPFLISRENGLMISVPEQLMFDPRNSEELAHKLAWISTPSGYDSARKLVSSIQGETWNAVTTRVTDIVKKLCGY